MKILKISTLLCLFLLAGTNANAQKIVLESGSLDFLKGISELNISYDFSDFAVGKFDTESAYIEKKKKDYNKKEEGKGDRWEAEWHADKENTYQRRFEELMNIVLLSKNTGITAGPFPDAPYTLVLKTTFLEPGYNVGISSKNASINVEIIFTGPDGPESPLAVISMKKVPGNGLFAGEFDSEKRIGEAYAQAGQKLAQFLWKKALK